MKLIGTSTLFVPLLLLPSLVWVLTDRSVWPWDQAWYGEVTADLWVTLVRDPAGWGYAMVHALSSKPPAVVWFGQTFAPLASVVGWEAALLLSVLATQAVALMLLHAALVRLLGPWNPATWAGTLSMAVSPFFIRFSHQYFAEPVQLLTVCLFLWIAVHRDAMSRLRLAAWLIVATALALAAKTTSPLYVFGFGLLALTGLILRKDLPPLQESPTITAALVVAAAGLAALTAIWYVENFQHVLQHALQSASGSVALHYGSVADFPTKLTYWLTSLRDALVLPDALFPALVAGALLIALSVYRLVRPRALCRSDGGKAVDRRYLALAAASQIVVALCVFSLNINEETRYLLPLFPSVAVLIALVTATAGIRPVAIGIAMLMLVQWGVIYAMALGLLSVRADTPWLVKRQIDGDRIDTIARLASATCPRASAGRYNVVGTEQPWLSANTLAFFSAKTNLDVGWRCYYTSLGYAETNADRAWKRLDEIKVDYVVMLDSDLVNTNVDDFNKVNAEVRHRVEASADFAIVPFPSVEGITVFKRQR